MNIERCPLCLSKKTVAYSKDKRREYMQCNVCKLVFVPHSYWVSADDEKAIYDLHQNDDNDKGYRQFLSRITQPLLERLGSNMHGLDFGCGPGPTLSKMLEEHGHKVDLYDPYYFNDKEVMEKTYDFICATEVVEHIHNPNQDLTTLFKMLKKGGWLGLMTKMVIDKQAFSSWHYKNDLTHVCFYSRDTFEFIAKTYGYDLTFIANDVVLFKKQI